MKWTDEERATAARLYAEGKSTLAIAAALNRKQGSVWDRLKRDGVTLRKRGTQGQRTAP